METLVEKSNRRGEIKTVCHSTDLDLKHWEKCLDEQHIVKHKFKNSELK